MALTYTVTNYGAEYSGAGSFTTPRGRFSLISVPSESRIIVDGNDLDLTGASAPATVRYEKAVWDEAGIGIVAEFARNADGDHRLRLIETDSALTGDGTESDPITVTNFPSRIRGAAQTGPFTAVPGSVTLASRRAGWFARLGENFTAGMNDLRAWWPYTLATSDERTRSAHVLNEELPRWWRAAHSICASAVRGSFLSGMTAAQVEACVAHLEALTAAGIIKIWYDVGLGLADDDTRASSYRSDATLTVGYTDAFSVAAGVLTPRTPDYAWNVILGYAGTEPDGWDPESPT